MEGQIIVQPIKDGLESAYKRKEERYNRILQVSTFGFQLDP